MQRWALTQQVEKRLPPEQAASRLPEGVQPYIALSRQAGTGGCYLGNLIAQKLGCPCLDREPLDALAEKWEVPGAMLEKLDKTTADWMHELFGCWLHERLVTQSTFMFHLGQIIVLAAREQRTVFVGRGAQFVLPRQKGLTVRLIAPMAQRIERIMERHGFDSRRAQKHLDEADRGRRDLIQRYFRRDVDDPSVRDLVINLEHIDHQEAADLIVDLYRRRFGPQE